MKRFPIIVLIGIWAAALNAATGIGADAVAANSPTGRTQQLFDGQSLNGWIQEPLYTTNLSAGDIKDLPLLVKKMTDSSNELSKFITEQLDESVKSALASFSADDAAATKTLKSSLVKAINKIIAGPALYDAARAQGVIFRTETESLEKTKPSGKDGARLNRMVLEDSFPDIFAVSPSTAWIVKDGAMASTGAGRGVIYTNDDFTKYRLMFTMRHVSGQPDHQPCVLIFCTRPTEGEKPLDALGGIQFQIPNGGHWDYRPGKNKGGEGFTQVVKPKFDNKQWSRVEILVDATAGTARMAVAQPVGSKAVEVLDYNMPEAGRTGPIAWQMHNGGLFDEYKDVTIEIDPAMNDLITTK